VWVLDSLEKARRVVDVAADKQATDIVMLDLREVTLLADFFVICTATTERQLRAVVQAVEEELSKVGEQPRQSEGTVESGWVLLDLGDVIVHVFAPAERRYYALDEFWSRAKRVVQIQ